MSHTPFTSVKYCQICGKKIKADEQVSITVIGCSTYEIPEEERMELLCDGNIMAEMDWYDERVYHTDCLERARMTRGHP